MGETQRNTRGKRERFTRESWLAAALDVLAHEGNSKLRVEHLSRKLGVSKGSFYWHFSSREDFLEAVCHYWHERFTKRAMQEAESTCDGPLRRLRALISLVLRENLSRYDFAFDAWASSEPAIASRVREVHRVRWRYVASLFTELGFTGGARDLRTRALLGYMKYQPVQPARPRKRIRDEELEELLRFFQHE